MATAQMLADLTARFTRDTGHLVDTESAGGVDVVKRVRSGERVDVVVLASTAIDELIEAGRLRAGSRRDLVKSGIAIAVKAGAFKPDITGEAAVRRAVLAAASISFSTGPSGVYLEKLFERWGILAELRGRIVVPPPGIPVGALVADGAVALGFQQLSELKNLPGIEVVGPLPSAIQCATIFSGGVAVDGGYPDAARALLDYLMAPATSVVKRRYGMETA